MCRFVGSRDRSTHPVPVFDLTRRRGRPTGGLGAGDALEGVVRGVGVVGHLFGGLWSGTIRITAANLVLNTHPQHPDTPHIYTYTHTHPYLEQVDGGIRDLLVLNEGSRRVIAHGLAVRVGGVLPAADEGCSVCVWLGGWRSGRYGSWFTQPTDHPIDADLPEGLLGPMRPS